MSAIRLGPGVYVDPFTGQPFRSPVPAFTVPARRVPVRLPHLDDEAVLAATAAHRSLDDAAAALGTSQASLSRRLRQMREGGGPASA